ncbi:hypothetical protein Tcan_17329 [Toxocara canis]|uniref:Uncharacterized protein n=1 Tax=Toxocara canis TaxID=6265 RepID=A0A0B2UN92_TOXCA|nr:hypothetical protein Tcan_17329 [Toxocara canis]
MLDFFFKLKQLGSNHHFFSVSLVCRQIASFSLRSMIVVRCFLLCWQFYYSCTLQHCMRIGRFSKDAALSQRHSHRITLLQFHIFGTFANFAFAGSIMKNYVFAYGRFMCLSLVCAIISVHKLMNLE